MLITEQREKPFDEHLFEYKHTFIYTCEDSV